MPDGFGSQLRSARVRKGMDVNTVARRLRIRPDIIQAIEEGDFERMPPRGYARNMINSYAQLLGLNASEVTNRYLDAQYAHQVDAARTAARDHSRSNGFDMPGSSRYAAGRADAARRRQAQQNDHYEISGYERGDLTRPRNAVPRDRQYADRNNNGRRLYNEYDSGRVMSRTEAERAYQRGGRHRSQSRVLNEEAPFNVVASPAPKHGLGSQMHGIGGFDTRLVALIAIGVILVIALLVLLLGRGCSSQSEETTLPVTSESASAAAASSSSGTSATAPTSFTFSYNVNSGTTTWIEVYIDGERQVAENVEGPATKTFTTSGVLEFICADPSGVKATQDGKDITLTTNDKGIVDIKIDFNDVLAQWQQQHGVTSSSASSSSSASTSSSSSSSSSSSLRGIDTEARAAASSSASSDDSDSSDDGSSDEDYSYDDSYDDEGYYDDGSSDDSTEY